ncbi:MAG TPA: VPDSG-CTERM sorting domain-containing protein [Lacunisphaera sp.]|nr:VPDSG-CTERM sorting domain-containing protein [Lacunisphaera sp.]
MKMIPKLAAGVMALGLMFSVSHARTFEFSYLFGDGLTASGSFEGTQNGLDVGNISNVSLFLDGSEIAGPLYVASFDGLEFNANALVSFDALANNFFFATSDLAGGDFSYESIFYLSGLAQASSISLNFISQDDPINVQNWSLTAVPDQGPTVAVLAIGLAGLAGFRRRMLAVRQ